MQVCILTKYLGAQWTAKILVDWGCKVSFEPPARPRSIIITDELSQESISTSSCLKIILTDLKVSNAHLLARSGVLSTFGQKQAVFVPKYVVESVISNSLAILCLQHFYQLKNQQEIKEQSLNVSIISLLKYFGAFFISAKANHLIVNPRGQNILEGGAPFYSVYKTQEGFLAVGNLQAKFYREMFNGLDLPEEEKEYWKDNQSNMDEWPKMRELLTSHFSTKTASKWQQHFKSYDTCVTEVKSPFKSNIVEPKMTPLRSKL